MAPMLSTGGEGWMRRLREPIIPHASLEEPINARVIGENGGRMICPVDRAETARSTVGREASCVRS